MENSPLNLDTGVDSEKKESKAKKKKAEALGAFVVEPKQEKAKLSKEVFELNAESETEAPLEHLAAPEKQFAEREFTKAEQAADLEPVEAVERFRNRIIIEGQDPEAALNETIAELEDLPDVENQTEAPTEVDDSPHEFGEEVILLNEPAETSPDEDEDSATAPIHTPASGPIMPTAGGVGSPPRSPGGSGPTIPGSPFGPGGAGPPFGSPGGPGGPGTGFNAAPVAPTPTVEYRRGNTIGPALVGGVVGYLIGRRRGRIKTEKRLIPVQKKLQKEVVSLQSELRQKEARIRALAITKVQESFKPLAEKARTPIMSNYVERPVAKTPERSASTFRKPAAEANQLHGKHHAPEQIGHVLVGAESFKKVFASEEALPKLATPEKPVNFKSEKLEKQQSPILSVEKNIDTLNRVDLLKLSEKIVIDGSSLRQIYETRLVGEKGLRRLVKEHLKGGDIKKALRQEIVEREIDFERDPGLRDHRPQPAAPKGGGRAATLNDLLQNAELAVGEDQEEVAFLKARSAYEEQEREQHKNHQKLMDVSFIGTILILFGIVIILVIRG